MKRQSLKEIIRKATHEAILEVVGTWEPEQNQMAQRAANWKTNTLPIVYGWDYVPESRGQANKEQEEVRKFVEVLENGKQQLPNNLYQRVQRKATTIIASTLSGAFGDKVANITLVPIPAQDSQLNARRWKDLMLEICSCSGAENGYGYYYYERLMAPNLSNGNLNGNQEGYWDRKFFSQKNVVLLDVQLSEQAMEQAKKQLEKLGANVIMGLVFAKTQTQ